MPNFTKCSTSSVESRSQCHSVDLQFFGRILRFLLPLSPGVCSFRWIWALFHRADFHNSIVMLWQKRSRHTRICSQISKPSTPQLLLMFILCSFSHYCIHPPNKKLQICPQYGKFTTKNCASTQKITENQHYDSKLKLKLRHSMTQWLANFTGDHWVDQ